MSCEKPDNQRRLRLASKYAEAAALSRGGSPGEYLGEAWILASNIFATKAAVERLARAMRRETALDESVSEKIDPRLIDIEQALGASVFEKADSTYTIKIVREILMTLPEREHRIISLVHGIGCPEQLQIEIAEDFDVCRERIGQIYNRGMRRIKHPSRSRKLRQCFQDSVSLPKQV